MVYAFRVPSPNNKNFLRNHDIQLIEILNWKLYAAPHNGTIDVLISRSIIAMNNVDGLKLTAKTNWLRSCGSTFGRSCDLWFSDDIGKKSTVTDIWHSNTISLRSK